jgi:hypothetical protein
MDQGGEAPIGLVAAHGDALELLQFAEEIFDEMPPLITLVVDFDRFRAARMLRDDNLCAAFVEIGNDGVAVEGFVGDQSAEPDAFDERCNSDDRLEPAHENPRSCLLSSAPGWSFSCRATFGSPANIAGRDAASLSISTNPTARWSY